MFDRKKLSFNIESFKEEEGFLRKKKLPIKRNENKKHYHIHSKGRFSSALELSVAAK